MKTPSELAASPLRRQAAETLMRARRIPRGPFRSDLIQLGRGLLQLFKTGQHATPVRVIEPAVSGERPVSTLRMLDKDHHASPPATDAEF